MKTSTAASLGLLILLACLGGCSSGSGSSSGGGGSSGTSISILPTSVPVGSPDVTLIIDGSDFHGDPHDLSWAVWSVSGTDHRLTNTFVSRTQLTAIIPATFLNNPVLASVFIETGDPTGDLPPRQSRTARFTVVASDPNVPQISSISPTEAVAGSGDLTLIITGNNFMSDPRGFHSVVAWSTDTWLETSVQDSMSLTAVVPATLLTQPTTAKVSVQTWFEADDTPKWTSNEFGFLVTAADLK